MKERSLRRRSLAVNRMTISKRANVMFAGCFLSALPATAEDAAGVEFFENEIRPILVDSCYKCHSASADKQKGGLYLDSRRGLLEGGDFGPSIVPGDPEKSLLIETVRYGNVDLQMPPKTRLSDEQVAALEKWITIGAPWPEGEEDAGGRREQFDLEKRKAEHWCWQAPENHPLPQVRDKDWPKDPIDHFILKQLEDTGLKPADDADRRGWVRRVAFDLTGLPPEPELVDRFIADDSEEAHAKVVDELLELPDFGVKWARHWLDLMRYAEGYGHEFDFAIPDAWRYRDHVVRAFNADLPYDKMIVEHVAGDLLETPRIDPDSGLNESLLATASWWLGEANHAPTDVRDDEMMRIDNQIDVASKAFLGLTVSCARCHDHKFDAISAADFYSLAGYLRSSRRQLAMQDPHGKIAEKASQLRELQAEASASRLDEGDAELVVIKDPQGVIATFDDGLPSGWTMSGEAFPKQPTSKGELALADETKPLVPSGVMHSGLYGGKLHGVLRSPTFTLEQPQIHLRLAASGDVEVRAVIDGYFMEPFNSLLFKKTRLDAKALESKGDYEWKALAGDLKKYVGHSVYLEFIDRGEGFIAIDEISYRKGGDIPKAEAIDESSVVALKPYFDRAKSIEADLPSPVYTLAMVDGTPIDEHVHIRGSHQTLGEETPRRFLTAMGAGGVDGTSSGSGRLALAREMVSSDNPLTSRVYVNRLWHHLMGKGLVATVDDFGVMGEEPSHPELLDQLALDFIADGWSTKRMIRRMVLSRTYRMSSSAADPDGKAAELDGANILLHKFRVRRLTSEAIRDGILAVSGELKREYGGPSVPVHLSSFMGGRGMAKSGPLDGKGKRSLYSKIRRNFLPSFQMTFDMPVPFTAIGRRSSSNVPAQSLALMNDPFVVDQAKKWAQRLLEEKDEEERIRQAYLKAFSREPRADEQSALTAFLDEQQSALDCSREDPKLWTEFCHLLFNQKEFIFIR